MADAAIQSKQVSKKFSRSLKRSMLYGAIDIIQSSCGIHPDSARLRKGEFWAVEDVSFSVKKGETLGLIGPNGSGKTTLLKMLNGIFMPDTGQITLKGKTGALIAVGAGFHPLLTGHENIYINGTIMGMTKKEIDKKFDSIVAFADIGDFLETPVKFYSSGMFVRLGFAIAVHSEPEILLVDEILAVGDSSFQSRCFDKMKNLIANGMTIVLVSHDLHKVMLMCDKTMYLHQGNIKHHGETIDVINDYKKDILKNRIEDFAKDKIRYGTKELEITGVTFLDAQNSPKNTFKRGETLHVRIDYTAHKNIENPEFAIGFSTENGTLLSMPTTRDHSQPVDKVTGKGSFLYSVKALPFTPGKYLISAGCWDKTGFVAYDHHDALYAIIIEDGYIDNKIHERHGLVYIPAEWSSIKT